MVRRAADIFAKLTGARSPSGWLRRCGAAAAVAVMIVAMPSAAAPAQEASEKALKVAFIYNFAKFTTWPDSAFGEPDAPVARTRR